ncbi:MAG: RNA polymerase factor sigma-54 [Legionellaceae bacterium]|nr:RNA polymerase factor sigma-54 [Legionellaceae bacterium]
MKPSLQLGLNQQLALTPQLQQAIRLLQMSTLDLQHEIQQVAEHNPLLDVDLTDDREDTGPDVVMHAESDHDWQWDQMSQHKRMDFGDNPDFSDNLYSSTTNLTEHLLWQLNLTTLSDTDRLIAEAIIEGIDNDGFLQGSIDDIRLGLAELNLSREEIEAVRHLIQRFDPLGCASLSLAECLLVQLSQCPASAADCALAEAMIRDSLELLAQHNYRLLKKKHHITDEKLNSMIQLIQKLHPKPGNLIHEEVTEYIVPDVTVKKIDGKWQVALNHHSLPKMRINEQYAQLAAGRASSADHQYIKTNLQEARWFLKSVQSRQDTLLKVATYIMKVQKVFLEQGEVGMKPLILHDVARQLELHESTISRVTTQKFIHTPRGVFELKYFFSSHVHTDNGGECSSTAIKAMIKEAISEEPSSKPYSDHQITRLIAHKGIHIARRTVAKYREAMGIAPSNIRKSVRS